ncbi:MAG: FtsX-like permease family protein [Eggerthellaceae bacterium]|nr:FtsX-like permease family protein [Eggerthellaceae bacterium]
MSAFSKSLLRSVRESLGRFLAIAAIVALGCGFYGGLRMTGPDMRSAADRFYDGTHLYDIRLLSTLGYSDSQIGEVSSVEGVENVMPSKSTDVMGDINGEQYAMRVSSLPMDSVRESTCEDGCDVESSDPSYLNRLVLVQGRWPEKAGECVISADRVAGVPFEMGDTLEVLYGSQDLEGVLALRSFTIVGTAHSSSFVSAVTMGATSLGSGSIQQFAYVTEDTFDGKCPYTELFVEVKGASALFSGSEEYEDCVDAVTKRLEGLAGELSASRLADIKREAQEELDEKSDEYETEKIDALAELDNAQRDLDEAEDKLQSGEKELASGYDEYNSGAAELHDRMSEAQTRLDDAYATLLETQAQLDASQAELDANRSEVDAWPAQREQLASQLSEAQQGLATALEGLSSIRELEEQAAALPEADPARIQIEAALTQRSQEKAQAEAAAASLPSTIEQIERGIAQGDALVAEFEKNQALVHDGYEQLSVGWTEYYQQADEAQRQFDEAQMELDAARDKLSTSQEEVDEGRDKLASGKAEYEDNRKRALDELSDAANVIAEAQVDIDSIEPPEIYVLDRSKNYGVTSQVSDSERIDNIAAVFPFVFFLVAALVALTTMTRMVEEERTLIGTFKALGYRKSRITGRYLVYAGVASVVGAAIGLAVLSQVLPYVISKAYAIIYNIPEPPLPLQFDWPIGLLAGGLGVGITIASTLAASLATLRETPASLMLPRTPKAGKRIIVERIGPLWRRMSFSWKVTLRNLFRYKKRLFMTVVGIAGCTALLLTGWGLHDALWAIIDKQYGPVVHYNVVVKLDEDASNEKISEVESELVSVGEAQDVNLVHGENMQMSSAEHDALGAELVVPADTDAFGALLTMKDRFTQQPLSFSDDSVVLTEKLARTLQVGVGDEVFLFEQDEIGNPLGDGSSLEVTGVMENYIGNWCYLGGEAYRKAMDEDAMVDTLYGRCTENMDKRAVLTDSLHDIEGVRTVTFNDETIDSYRTMLSSVDMIVVVLVVSAAALAFIVLYNLTNINITERRREIATIKVLGFSKRETSAYIFREITLLSLLGSALGLVLGVLLESFVVVTAEVDYVMFGRDIHPLSFVLSVAMTLVFSAFVMLFMRRKLDDVGMVESLKSVE